MNIKFNLWREESLSSLVKNDNIFVCVKCQGQVKHPLYHYIRYHWKEEKKLTTIKKNWIKDRKGKIFFTTLWLITGIILLIISKWKKQTCISKKKQRKRRNKGPK